MAENWYNLSNASDATDLFHYFSYVNNIADGLFFPVILLVVWVISFMATFTLGGSKNVAKGFIFSTFFVTILGSMLAIMGLLNPKYMYLPIILLAFGVLWLRLSGAKEQ